MISDRTRGARITPALGAIVAVIGTILVLTFTGTRDVHADGGHDHALHAHTLTADASSREAELHDWMRKLWEDHVTWTRLAIISFAHDLPDLPATHARLLRIQADIGDAVKPYYGRRAGNRLTGLLEEHIVGAVALLQAAKAGDAQLIEQRSGEWYANGDEIADFLHAANPRNWSRKAMRRMMNGHLDQTLREAVNRLRGDYDADVRDYEVIHHHILAMADMLTDGIVEQFPRRFR